MANNRVINGIAVDDAVDNGKAPIYNSTTKVFDMTNIGGSGTVTSVAMSVPTGLTITGSPVTTTGTLAVALDTGYVIPLQSTIDGKQSTITFGTGVQTALGVNIGSAGAPVLFNGAGGTPSSLTGTNITGTALGLTAGAVTNATLTTALTVNTGTVTLTGNVANTSVLTIGAGAVSVSGSNTGDQTTISGNAGTATTLQNTRTIWGQNFNGSANVTGTLALGTADLTLTGSIGATGARATKVWAADMEVTNAIVGSITGNAATVSSANEATDTTCFPLFITASGTQTLATKNNTSLTFNASTAQLGATTFNAGTGYQVAGAAASNKILKGNGTNFVASTETYAAPGTSGNVMTSDGTNWTSAAPAGGGNPGWDFVSYTTASAATDITVSSLNLATDGGIYMVIVKAAGTTAADYRLQFNAETAGYTWGAQQIVTAGAAFSFNQVSSTSDSGVLLVGNTDMKSMSATMYISEMLLFDGTNTQINVDFSAIGSGSAASNDGYEKNIGTGITENIEDNITSLKFLKSSGTANWRVWVFKAATS